MLLTIERRPASWRVPAAALFLSGCSALIYEVIWARQLALVMGNTVESISTVLATFMAGLGLGSVLAARLVDRLRPATLPGFYAGLEAGVAFFALGFPFLLEGATPLLAGVYRVSTGSPGLLALARLATCSLFLLIPTTLMGATLPALTAFATAGRAGPGFVGKAAGLLYAANTLGAVAGSLSAGLVLIAFLGITRSNLLALALNVAAAGLVLAFSGPAAAPSETREKKARSKWRELSRETDSLAPAVVLAVMALSGLGALANEVAWTRALVLLIGPTAYGFSFILASVIAGIALGSAAAARWAERTERPARALGGVEMAAFLASMGVLQVVGALPVPLGELVRENADRMGRLMAMEFLWVFLLLVVPSFFFGSAFPLAVRLLSRSASGPGRAVGLAYAWNTAGAILGALLGGFAALPLLGLENTLYAAAGAHAAAGALALAASSPERRRLALAGVFLVASGLAPFLLPPWDRELFSGGVYKYAAYLQEGELLDSLQRGELVYYREGRTATVSVKQTGGKLSLAIDGKVDATNAGDMLTQKLLAHLPLLLHPAPGEVCVIGLGSGATVGSALTHPISRLDVVEISPEVVEAASFFREANRNALADPRLRLVVGDGRNHLLLTDRRYDVIISEPSNPWMAGVSSLFTRDFFRLARQRLAPGGLFCQWAHIYNMAEPDLKTVVAGFTDVFPEAALFLVNEGDILLVGAAEDLVLPRPESLAERMTASPAREDLAEVEVRNLYSFASLFALRTPALSEWAAGAERHTDDRPLLEFRAPRFLHADTSRENRARILEASRRAGLPEPFASLCSRPTAEEMASRGLMLEKAESFEWAMETYREALAKDPRLPAAHEGVVRTAISLGRTAQVEQELLRLAEGPSSVETRIGLGLLYRNVDRLDDALAELQRALQSDPTNARALLLAAEIEGERGHVDSMEELAGRALAARPGDPEAESFLAEAQLRRGNLEQALIQALSILSRNPQLTRALEVAAIARAERGDREGARKDFARLVAAEPDSWVHLNNWATFEMQSNNFQAAARLFEQAVDINPRNLRGYLGLLEAARLLGDGDRIERARSMLALLNPSPRP